MPWEASAHVELPIIETSYSGVLTPEELTEAVRQTLILAKTHDRALFLGDCTRLTGGIQSPISTSLWTASGLLA